MNPLRAKRGRRVLVALLALLGVPILALALRLASGPLPVDALRTAIEAALVPEEAAVEIQLDHTALLWRGGPRVLAQGLRVLGPEGQELGRFREVVLSLSGLALLRGRIAVIRIELQQPVVRIVRGRDGRLQIGLDRGEAPRPPEQSPLLGLFAAMLAPADSSSALGSLRRVVVKDADLELEDHLLGVTWRAPDSDLELSRGNAGLRVQATLELDLAGRRSRVTAELDHDREKRSANLTLRLSEFDPGLVSMAFPELALDGFVSVGLPLSGTLGIQMRLAEALEAVDVTELRFDLAGGAGSLRVRGLGLEPLAVDALRLAGRIHTDLTHLELYDVWLEQGGSRLTLSAWAKPAGDDIALRLDARVRDFDVARLGDWWPADSAPAARDWIVPNIPHGEIVEGRVEVSARLVGGDPSELSIDALAGTFEARGLVVHYLSPMPPATEVSTTARFDGDGFDFALRGGHLGELRIVRGEVAISGLREKDEVIAIEGDVRGSLRSALALLDHEPLRLLSDLRFDLHRTRGRAETHLRLDFPLAKDLRTDQIAIDASSQLHAVEIEGGPLGLDAREGELSVEATHERMRVTGELLLGGEPARLHWREDFTGAEPVTRIDLTSEATEVSRGALALLDPDPLGGPVGFELGYAARRDGTSRTRIALDLTGASLDLPWIAWHKAAGVEAGAELSIRAAADGGVAIRKLRVAAPDLALDSRIELAPETFALRSVEIGTLRYPEGDVRGSLRVEDGGVYDLRLHGARIDLGPLLSQASSARDEGRLPPFRLEADLDELRLGGKDPLPHFRASARYDGAHFEGARIDFGPPAARASARYEPVPDGLALAIRVPDLGQVLRATSFGVELTGGHLVIGGRRADPGAPVEGRFELSNFRVTSDVAIARLLQAFSLVDLLDALRREGLHFRALRGDFAYQDGSLRLSDARAEGASLGFTSRGTVDLDAFTANLEGKLLPLYTVNTMVGRIPLVGPVVTGSDGALVGSFYRASGPLGDLRFETGRAAKRTRDEAARRAPTDG